MDLMNLYFPIEDININCNKKQFDILKNKVVAEPLNRIISKLIIKNLSHNLIDLGSWKGDSLLPWSKLISKGQIAFGIDPSIENTKFISEIVNNNDISNVNLITEAISDSSHRLGTMHDITHCMFTRLEHDNRNINWKNIINSTTLDLLYLKNILFDVDFIHLDVEGMELHVIKGSINMIKKNHLL
jgi:FkbM family methyltransferase